MSETRPSYDTGTRYACLRCGKPVCPPTVYFCPDCLRAEARRQGHIRSTLWT